jgi:hypothetical protein
MAWIALLFFIFIVVNILFIHVYVTESAAIFLIYVLIFMFGSKRNLFQSNPSQNHVNANPEQADNSEVPESIDSNTASADISGKRETEPVKTENESH